MSAGHIIVSALCFQSAHMWCSDPRCCCPCHDPGDPS